jgi:hypothetical protein
MGVFSENQPVYAERGIATFPLGDNKVPAVSNYQKMGLPASSKLADRFRNANGFGYMTNARTRVSVLDVDTTDERVLADAMARHGSTPLVARTASGKFHALYKHNGEYRKIRPFGAVPIDVLGIGGLVVAPPSRFAKGAYSFIQGSLDDLDRLPVMHGLDPSMYGSRDSPNSGATPTGLNGAFEGRPALEGVRNYTLWSYCMRQLSITDADIDAIVAAARIRNATYAPPLPDEEVVKTASSAWGYTAQGRNWFGNGQVVSSHAEVDELLTEAPDAFLLLAKLRRHNWGKPFIIANAMAERMGWTRKRFAAARAELERRGKILCLRRGNGVHGAPLYAWR